MSSSLQNHRPLRLGFVGGSLRSAVGYTHFASSQLDGRWEVVSGCFSTDIDVGVETGRRWGIGPEMISSDWREYLARNVQNLDAVAVLTPTPLHADVCCVALDLGIPVICEKAVASTLKQSEQLGRSLKNSDTFFAVTYNYSGYPMVRVLREVVRSGQIGAISHVDIEMPSDAYVKSPAGMPQKWRLKDEEIPTILLDLGVHVCHLMRFITGLSANSVNAVMRNYSKFSGLIDDARMWVEYPQVSGSFWLSKVSLGYRNGLKIRVFGSDGAAFWYQEEPEKLHITREDSSRTVYDRGNTQFPQEIRERFKPGHPSGFIEAFSNLYTDIAESLMAHKNGESVSKYVEGWQESHEDLMLLSAATRSHHEKSWIKI